MTRRPRVRSEGAGELVVGDDVVAQLGGRVAHFTSELRRVLGDAGTNTTHGENFQRYATYGDRSWRSS